VAATRALDIGALIRRGLTRAVDLLLPLALLAAAAALVVPSQALAERSDFLLAGLVLLTALCIPPSHLLSLRDRKVALALLVLAPFAFLVPLAWGVSQLFAGSVREGILALGVASTEVAAVGLVAVAGGSAALALGALTGSLVLSAVAGPPVLGVLAGAGADVAVGELVGRFALVVLLPLAVGLGARARLSQLEEYEGALTGAAAVTVAVLVYAAMSGAADEGGLLSALAASALFLALTGLPAAAWARFAPCELRITGALVIGLRDFAVAAALAAQAFGPAAGAVAGVYGVLMLLAGAAAAQLLPRLTGPDSPWKA
jgi:predicted Na+-dependent transporter